MNNCKSNKNRTELIPVSIGCMWKQYELPNEKETCTRDGGAHLHRKCHILVDLDHKNPFLFAVLLLSGRALVPPFEPKEK